MDRLDAGAAYEPIPMALEQGLFLMGGALIVMAVIVWMRKDIFGDEATGNMRKVGLGGVFGRMTPERGRKISVFFAYTWAVLGIALLAGGFIVLLSST